MSAISAYPAAFSLFSRSSTSTLRKATHAETDAAVPCIDSYTLLRGNRVVQIRHQGVQYCLRHTRSGKLILTK